MAQPIEESVKLQILQICEANNIEVHELRNLCDFLLTKEDLRKNNAAEPDAILSMRDYLANEYDMDREDAAEFVEDYYNTLTNICHMYMDLDATE